MSIVIVGGHSRNIGKTSVVAGLISALPERQWLAMKITQHGHSVCSVSGEDCDCAVDEHTWSIDEERDRSGESDTSRFVLAGARRTLWVRCKQGYLAEAMPELRREIARAENVIIESNTAMRFLRPDVYLSVLDFATADFKDSAREYLDLASALIVHEPAPGTQPAWKSVSLKPAAGKPVFRIAPPQYVTPEIVEFVRERLAVKAETGRR